MPYHASVMPKEVLAHLQVEKGKRYIDATLGDGGHSLEILKAGGVVLGIDINEQSLARAVARIKESGLDENFEFIQGNFAELDSLAQTRNFGAVSGILFDLGYSSTQLETDDLGLSFQTDQTLDMRLDKSLNVTAADLVNSLSEKELTQLIFSYSDERLAKTYAKAIVKARGLKKIQTTQDLVTVLLSVAPPGYEHGRIHPATRTLQALRIVVNDELTNLERSLPRAARLLLPGGKLVVISFHSLEDKLVKEFGIRAQPMIKLVVPKPLVPTEEEVSGNRRARSAKMRVFERVS